MKVIDPGHQFELDRLDVPRDYPEGGRTELLTFVKRSGEKYPGNTGSHPGTTSQEVLRALIYRGIYVQSQRACAETAEAIGHLIKALHLLEARAARLHGRPAPTPENALYGATCPGCGYVGCAGGCGRA